MNLVAKPISTRFEIYFEEKQFKAITEYNKSLDTVRSSRGMLDYIVYDKTCATNTELFADLEGGYIFFTLAKADDSPAEHKSIMEIIEQFVSEALDPEMYIE